MQTYEVVVTETAENEIDEYLDFIAGDSLENAIGWYNNIYDEISTLSELALRCPVADENPYFEFEIRCLLVKDYRVLYRINGNIVEVLHIKHPRMDR
ncbi:MAG: type II toxin-antitoxin system RelE/ParE family toxin [Pseudomonadota bacterium]